MDKREATFQRPRVVTPFSVSLRKDNSGVDSKDQTESPTAPETCSALARTSLPSPTRYICLNKEEHAKVYCSSKIRPTPVRQMDLNTGFEVVIPKKNEGEKIDILLSAISLYTSSSLLSQTDLVCYRGVLTKIAASPYDVTSRFDDGWIFAAHKRNNIIYLCETPTKRASNRKENESDRDKLMQYWGHKFETYICSSPNCAPQPTAAVDLNDEFCLLVSSKLDGLRLMFVGEVDCSFSEDRTKYVELKTSRQITNDREYETFCRFKLYKWWLQSFLIGIEDILCGFRDDHGYIMKLEWFKVAELHKLSQDYLGFQCWDPSTCLSFLSQTLRHVTESITESDKLYLVTRNQGKIDATVTECSAENVDQYSFMPPWFAPDT